MTILYADGDHTFKPIAEIAEEIREEVDAMLKTCSARISELCNLEKQTWLTVDGLTEKCQAMTKQVDETTEQQVISGLLDSF